MTDWDKAILAAWEVAAMVTVDYDSGPKPLGVMRKTICDAILALRGQKPTEESA